MLFAPMTMSRYSCGLLAILALLVLVVAAVRDPKETNPQKKPLKSGKDLKMPVNFPEKKARSKGTARERQEAAAAADWSNGQDWGDEDLFQHPIDEEPRRKNRNLGEVCSYSSDCDSGCCLMQREDKVRSCQPKAFMGEKCSSAQVKGDLWVDACPCDSGEDSCDMYSGICRA